MLDADGSVSDSSLAVGQPRPARPRRAAAGAARADLPRPRPAAGLAGRVAAAGGSGRAPGAGSGSSSSAPRPRRAPSRSPTCVQLLLIGGPVALLLASLAAYGVAAARAASRSRRCGPGRRRSRPPSPTSGCRCRPTDDEVARLGQDAERDARAPRRGARARAGVRRRRQPRAAHAAGDPADRAGAGAGGGRSPEELRAALASAAEETDRLTQLSEDLLTIAQTERGELPAAPGSPGPAEILDGVGRRFARRAEERGARSRSRLPRRCVLEADRLRLDQAIGSMVDNALRYGAGPDRRSGRPRRRRVGRDPRPRRGRGVPGGVPRPGLRALQPGLLEQPRRRQRPRAGDRADRRPRPRRRGARRQPRRAGAPTSG